jgi:SAM-dependent methyltransferase
LDDSGTVSMRTTLARLRNGLRRVAAGLPPAEEAVWPGVRNDLFVAHEAVYSFATGFAHGARTLDAACGTGYGSHILAANGARSVLGIDREPRRVRFAQRRYRLPNLEFRVADCTSLELAIQSLDFVVSSNTLEHLQEPESFLRAVAGALAPNGRFLIVVPPVLSAADLGDHRDNPFHLSPLSVQAWAELFEAEGWKYEFFAQYCSDKLDFASPHPSAVRPSAFSFVAGPLALAYSRAPISAAYLLRRG